MRLSKNLAGLFLVPFLAALPLFLHTVHSEETGAEKLSFRWAFGAMVGSEGDQRLVAITRDTSLRSGNRIKMLVELREKCYVYLFYRMEDDQIFLLFPDTFNQFETDYRTGKKYYISHGDRWFELDQDVGLETFYLLVSTERLASLEALFSRYERAESVRKRSLSTQVLEEIRRIKRKHRKFEASAERPVPIGGNVRGVRNEAVMSTPDIDPIADVVSAREFYSGTFTIDHR